MKQKKIDYEKLVKQANRSGDALVLAICLVSIGLIALVTFIITFAIAADVPQYLEDESLGGYFESLIGIILLVGAGVILALIVTRMVRQLYLGNALHVEYSDYAWLRKWSNEVARDFAMPKVEIMVTQDPVMNAFAFGFMQPYTIVLNSGTIRYLNNQQLKAIVVHEMAHVKYHHTQIGTYTSVLRTVPLFGGLFGWILDFWGRRAELTADRLALLYLQDSELVKMSLIRVHVGPDVADSFNAIARQWQVYMTHNFLNKFTQTFSGHPFLVRRLQHIDTMSARYIQSSVTSEDTSSAATP